MEGLEAKVIDIIRGVLVKHKASIVISPSSKMGEPPEWDSLAFVEIFTAVSGHFGVEVCDDDAISFMSVPDIVGFLSERV